MTGWLTLTRAKTHNTSGARRPRGTLAKEELASELDLAVVGGEHYHLVRREAADDKQEPHDVHHRGGLGGIHIGGAIR